MKIICDNCQNNTATHHQRFIINNLAIEQHLCDSCYAAMKQGADLSAAARQENICPYCKTTLGEVVNSSYLGCPNCYKQFRSVVLKNIVKIHTGRRHVGKRIERSEAREAAVAEYNRILGLLLQAREEGRADDAKRYENLLMDMTGDGDDR